MKILTVRQPWASALINGWKPVENRSWKPPRELVGKRIGIHASARPMTRAAIAEHNEDAAFIRGQVGILKLAQAVAKPGAFGVVLGTVVLGSPRREPLTEWGEWFYGPWGWPVSEPRPLAVPIPARGRLGFWDFDLPDGA